MAEPFADKVMRQLDVASELYHRLIIVAAPAGAGKSSALRVIRERNRAPIVNVNLELSRRLLDLTERQRVLHVPQMLAETFNSFASEVILLDNTEILFDVSLRQDPLRLLQGISRQKTIVVSWNGLVISEQLTYAGPDHPEYRQYSSRGMLLVSPEVLE